MRKNGHPLIKRDELTEYCKMPMARVRLFGGNASGYEMSGDGFIRQAGKNFMVNPDCRPGEPYMLKSGDLIGIEIEGMIGFYLRSVVL